MSAVAETTQTEMPAPLIFTDSAAAKVADLVAEEGNPDLKLRVFVQGGGCSGFQYGFTFDEVVNEDDTQMTKNGVSLLIDAMIRDGDDESRAWLQQFRQQLDDAMAARRDDPGAFDAFLNAAPGGIAREIKRRRALADGSDDAVE